MKKPKRKRREPTSWWSWPLPDSDDLDLWTDSQLRTATLHPMVTGLGRHPRSISDERWVPVVIDAIAELGDFRFWYGFVKLLRASMPDIIAMSADEYPPLKAYPCEPHASKLPLPSAQVMGDRLWASQQKWTGGMVAGVFCNPVLAGIPPFEAILPLQQWAETAAAMCGRKEEGGPEQYLVNVLYCLRSTYGCSGQPYGRIPYGFTLEPPNQFEEED